MKEQHNSVPAWADMDSQHPRGVPVVKKDEYWLYAEESAEGWHITGVRENAEHGLSEVHIPTEVDGKPVISLHLDWTYDPEHPRYVGQLYFPDCIPGIDGRSLRYVRWAQLVKTEKPCFLEKESVLLTLDGKTVVVALISYQRYYFIPDGVENIGRAAFYEKCPDKIFLPDSLRSIGEHAFEGTPRLRSLVIPEGVTRVGDGAFADSGIEAAILPESIEVLGHGAFAGSSLLEITVPPRVRTLKGTFMYCTELRRVHLHDGMEEIGPYTFQVCERLQRIVLPATVTKVDAEAFAECDAEVVRG